MTSSKMAYMRIFLFACLVTLSTSAFGMRYEARQSKTYDRDFPSLHDALSHKKKNQVRALGARKPIDLEELERMCGTLKAHRQYVQTTGADGLFEQDLEIVRTLGKKIEKLRKIARRGQLNDKDLTHFRALKAQYKSLLSSGWVQAGSSSSEVVSSPIDAAEAPTILARGNDDSPTSEHEITPTAGPVRTEIVQPVHEETALILLPAHQNFRSDLARLGRTIQALRTDKRIHGRDLPKLQEAMEVAHRAIEREGYVTDEDRQNFAEIERAWFSLLSRLNRSQLDCAPMYRQATVVVPANAEPANAVPAIGAAVNNAPAAPNTAAIVPTMDVPANAAPANAVPEIVPTPEVVHEVLPEMPAIHANVPTAHAQTWWQSWGRKAAWCALPVVVALIAVVIGHSRSGSWWPRRMLTHRRQHSINA